MKILGAEFALSGIWDSPSTTIPGIAAAVGGVMLLTGCNADTITKVTGAVASILGGLAILHKKQQPTCPAPPPDFTDSSIDKPQS